MQARDALIEALLRINTLSAAQEAFFHSVEMTRLNGRDNQGLRNVVPWLLLRLGEEKENFRFMRWWLVTDQDENYDRSEPNQPPILIEQDPFRPVIEFLSANVLNLSHLIALTLLKIRLVLDLKTLYRSSGTGTRPRVLGNTM